jgi:hypothetical protein
LITFTTFALQLAVFIFCFVDKVALEIMLSFGEIVWGSVSHFANKKAKNHTQNVQNVEKVLLARRANYLDLVLLKRFGQIQISKKLTKSNPNI